MGVKNTKKKLPWRVKRTIRRTISGICILSAIIVSLVPPQRTSAYTAPGTVSLVSYDYGVSASDSTDLSYYDSSLTGIVLDKYNNASYPTFGYTNEKDITKTYMVRQTTDGSFDYNWQFKVYPQLVNGTNYSIICKYNDTYASGVISIEANIPMSYSIVEKDYFDNYIDAHKLAKSTSSKYAKIPMLDGSDYAYNDIHSQSKFEMLNIDSSRELDNTKDDYWIKNYFPTQYATYKSQYTDWVNDCVLFENYKTEMAAYDTAKTAYDNYVSDPGNYPAVPEPTLPQKPVYSTSNTYTTPVTVGTKNPQSVMDPTNATPSITLYVADMAQNSTGLYKYFCVNHPEYYRELAVDETYVLDEVKDSRGGIGGLENQYVYMPRGEANKAFTSSARNDEFGFRITGQTSIIGIGANAFANTTNVSELKLAGEVKYIGDYAFYKSFVNKITFSNVQDIGNRAFKECTRLTSVAISDATVNIGTEAFYGCNVLDTVALSQSISYVGPGAFAECIKLTSIDLTAINQSCNISDYAFYNDIALSNVVLSDNIARLGDACFACSSIVTGNLLTFNFPNHISGSVTEKMVDGTIKQRDAIGNFVLAGRTNLLYVNMPADYGKSTVVELPYGTFYNCSSLKRVTFPSTGGSCGYVTFEKKQYLDKDGNTKYRTMFDTVQTEDFCVYGPEKNIAGDVASPRSSTWGLKSGLGNDIPYIYNDAYGKEHVEISNGEYIMIIDDNGVITSCDYATNTMRENAKTYGLNLVIPEYVGDKKVTGVSSTCFSEPDIHNYIKTITIKDNTITEIAADAFKDCTMLEKVYIGNSVTKIGDRAFKGCNNLTYVSFETPVNGYSSFPVSNIGSEAFATGADSLIFEGDIDTSYGPFVWAMGLDNYVDANLGTRVCYKTGYPTYLTVIVDNRNGYPTLVDHPHYDQLNSYSDSAGTTITYKDENQNTLTADMSLTNRYEHLGEEFYDYTNPADPVLYTYSVSVQEERMIKAAIMLDVPSGIKSIDVKGFVTNTSKKLDSVTGPTSNTVNVSKYLSPSIKNYSLKNNTVLSFYIDTYKEYGLFKGYYGSFGAGKQDYDHSDPGSDAALYEKEDIGNDRLESIVMNTVEYLPDYAFYSCEKLSSITLGDSMKDLGTAPFTGCTSLTSIGSTTPGVTCYNGIVYSENPDGTYNIVEVLSARGKTVGSKKIKASDDDPYLANVSTISPGAFENCDYITSVDFQGMSLLKEIPDNCFKDCDSLNQVILPDNITAIGHKAFSGAMEGIELVCYGSEVYLPNDAFDGMRSMRVVSYKNSAVRKAAADLGADVSEVLDDTVKVQFYDYDGTELSKLLYINVGTSIALEDIPANPVRTGYTFAGWNKPLTNITTDSVIVATYTQNPSDNGSSGEGGNNEGGNQGGNNQGGTGDSGNNQGTTEPVKFYTLTVTNGNGSGSYAAGATVIITCTEPPSGQVFDKWVPTTDDLGIASVNVAATTLKMPAHEASVTATFKKASSSGGSGSGVNNNVSGNNQGGNNTGNTGSTILISKPGVSNTGLASAQVSGSSDNYVIRIAETAAATAAVEKALTNEYGSLDTMRYTAMDITLYDATGTNRITNYSGLSITITMPIPDVMTQYGGNCKVAAVTNEKLEKLTPKFTSIDGVPCIKFTATHFSPYTIYVDTGNISQESIAIDTSPKTGDGIAPKWFLVIGLLSIGIALFFVKDKKPSLELA